MEEILVSILEDIAVVRSRIIEMLVDLKIDQFLEADSAHGAVEVFVLSQPKVAVLDIQVPGISGMKSGIDVLRWIRKNHPQTAVIMLTNNAQPIYRSVCLTMGAVYFFDKSSEFEKLHDAVEALLAA